MGYIQITRSTKVHILVTTTVELEQRKLLLVPSSHSHVALLPSLKMFSKSSRESINQHPMLKYMSLCVFHKLKFKAITARKCKVKKADSISVLRNRLKKSHSKCINNSVLPSFICIRCKSNHFS